MAEYNSELPETNCPRQLFSLDLKEAIEQKINCGHKILVIGDFNSEYSKLANWMAIVQKHI